MGLGAEAIFENDRRQALMKLVLSCGWFETYGVLQQLLALQPSPR